MWFCYILRNTQPEYARSTYNGSTNNPKRRLRQHNCEITGGAKVTTQKGGGWEYCAILSGFPDKINCLSCEWRIKCPSGRPGRRAPKYNSPAGRVGSLNEILPLEYWTKQCVVNNREFQMKLHVVTDLYDKLDTSIIPSNIEVIQCEKIDTEMLDIENDIYVTKS
jgi:predicted GIY-YIG superfamily endonuclease|uniref:GIY-YIG domain-containing protein n=1 Tax=viral metagenome TaxID=1070528 RepID=A0A6C0IKY5_9ZZZZ